MNDLFFTFGQFGLKQSDNFFAKPIPPGRAFGQVQFAIACGRVGCLLGARVAELLDALEDGVAVAVEGALELGIVVDDLVEEAGHVVVDDVVFVAQFLLGGEDDLPADAEFVDGHRHGMVKREDALEYEYAFEYLKCGGTAHARRVDSVGE